MPFLKKKHSGLKENLARRKHSTFSRSVLRWRRWLKQLVFLPFNKLHAEKPPTQKFQVIHPGGAVLREGILADSAKVAVVHRGEVVRLLEETGRRAHVRLDDGTSGWMSFYTANEEPIVRRVAPGGEMPEHPLDSERRELTNTEMTFSERFERKWQRVNVNADRDEAKPLRIRDAPPGVPIQKWRPSSELSAFMGTTGVDSKGPNSSRSNSKKIPKLKPPPSSTTGWSVPPSLEVTKRRTIAPGEDLMDFDEECGSEDQRRVPTLTSILSIAQERENENLWSKLSSRTSQGVPQGSARRKKAAVSDIPAVPEIIPSRPDGEKLPPAALREVSTDVKSDEMFDFLGRLVEDESMGLAQGVDDVPQQGSVGSRSLDADVDHGAGVSRQDSSDCNDGDEWDFTDEALTAGFDNEAVKHEEEAYKRSPKQTSSHMQDTLERLAPSAHQTNREVIDAAFADPQTQAVALGLVQSSMDEDPVPPLPHATTTTAHEGLLDARKLPPALIFPETGSSRNPISADDAPLRSHNLEEILSCAAAELPARVLRGPARHSLLQRHPTNTVETIAPDQAPSKETSSQLSNPDGQQLSLDDLLGDVIPQSSVCEAGHSDSSWERCTWGSQEIKLDTDESGVGEAPLPKECLDDPASDDEEDKGIKLVHGGQEAAVAALCAEAMGGSMQHSEQDSCTNAANWQQVAAARICGEDADSI